ncbi:MAG: hypothetical protein OSB66_07785 [SAR202 cluster bacterium]|nr:hypothetical protein [SAR202 cluster bacterium]
MELHYFENMSLVIDSMHGYQRRKKREKEGVPQEEGFGQPKVRQPHNGPDKKKVGIFKKR